MYGEYRFISDIDEHNVAVVVEDEKCDAVCIVMSKEQVYQMDVGLVNIPVENTCVYGENKCIFFAGTLFAININTLKVKSIPKLQKIFYLDTGIFAVTKKQSRYDCFVKIDINDFYVRVIGRFKYRDMER